MIAAGFEIAATGDQARAPVDVALVDAQLPQPGEGLRLIAHLAPTIPVIAISINPTLRPAALAAGAVAFTEKDGNADALLALVRRASSTSPAVGRSPRPVTGVGECR